MGQYHQDGARELLFESVLLFADHDALVIDTLKEEERSGETQKVLGSILSSKGLSTILGAGASSVIVSRLVPARFILAILLTIGTVGIGLLISLFIKEPRRREVTHALSPWELLSKSIVLLRQNKKLARLMALAIFTTPFTGALISLYQPYFQNLRVPGQWFGLAYAIGGLLLLLSSKYAYLIEEKLGGKRAMLIFTLLPGVIFGLMAVTGNVWLAVTFFCLNYSSAALQHPLIVDYTNRHITSENRATLLSFIGMLSSLYVVVMGPVIGAIADRSVSLAFLFMGGLIIAGALVFRISEEQLVGETP